MWWFLPVQLWGVLKKDSYTWWWSRSGFIYCCRQFRSICHERFIAKWTIDVKLLKGILCNFSMTLRACGMFTGPVRELSHATARSKQNKSWPGFFFKKAISERFLIKKALNNPLFWMLDDQLRVHTAILHMIGTSLDQKTIGTKQCFLIF
jgi:hypothetical protein